VDKAAMGRLLSLMVPPQTVPPPMMPSLMLPLQTMPSETKPVQAVRVHTMTAEMSIAPVVMSSQRSLSEMARIQTSSRALKNEAKEY
jgi:hypothetical protein